MKKKLALLMAAIMTVAMVPMTAFASTKLTAVDEVATAVGEDHVFTSTVELVKSNDQEDVRDVYTDADGVEVFDVELKLTNGKFEKNRDGSYPFTDTAYNTKGVRKIVVQNDTTATITLNAAVFNKVDTSTTKACVLPIKAYAVETGDVIATFSSNARGFKSASEVIATAYDNNVTIESEGVVTFVEDSDRVKDLKDISIDALVLNAISDSNDITLKLKGNYKYAMKDTDVKVGILNEAGATAKPTINDDKDELTIDLGNLDKEILTKITISGIKLEAEKSCNAGDVATITVSSKDFDSVKLEVAKMVEEAVTYTVEDDDLPTIWAGKDYDETNTLEVSIEENTGDILNTSRKATFTFPEGIEVEDIVVKHVVGENDLKEGETYDDYKFEYEIDENVVSIWNYGESEESDATDMTIKFILNAAPTFSGDVKVTLGGEFDDVELKVAAVKAPYTIEAKTSEVLIDYRYVPVNEIVITEAEEGILEEGDKIYLEVEKMDFEDSGKYEVTTGDIEVDVTIDDNDDNTAQLVVEVKDDSTEASTITISGLELYLDRTLPVGGYALKNVGGWNNTDNKDRENKACNILWENSFDKKDTDGDRLGYDENGIFKYSAVTVNDSYVEVVTAGRDQDDSTTTKKIVITIGATTMAVGTETVTLDAPAYINSDNYTMLPLRAVSEAFGATVGWDDASRTVTLMMGQRIVSMTIGSKTMYINGTPVAMNTAPEIVSERTFLPVRDLCNALGITKIDWNEASATVTLN